MLVQWKYIFVFTTFCTTQHVTSSILIDHVLEDISLSFSENNATVNTTDSSDIQPRKRDINTLSTDQSSTELQTSPETVSETEEGHHGRSVRAIRPGFSRGGRGGFGRGAFRAFRGGYSPYWGGRYNPYWGGGYGYYPYYYGGYYPLRPRWRRPAIIIG